MRQLNKTALLPLLSWQCTKAMLSLSLFNQDKMAFEMKNIWLRVGEGYPTTICSATLLFFRSSENQKFKIDKELDC